MSGGQTNEFGKSYDWAFSLDDIKCMDQSSDTSTHCSSAISRLFNRQEDTSSCTNDPMFIVDRNRYSNTVFNIGSVEINLKFRPVKYAAPTPEPLKITRYSITDYGSMDVTIPLANRMKELCLKPYKANSSKGYISDCDSDVDLYCHESLEDNKYIE